MSHNIKLSGVNFTDLALLGRVIADVSKGAATLDPAGKTFRTYNGQPNGCDAVIKLPGRWDIGLHKKGNKWEPIFESELNYSGSVIGVPGNAMGLAQQEYILREAEYEAAQKGMSTSREVGPGGRISLVCEMAD